MAIADTPKARYLIHDDEPAAAPAAFDTRTCQEKHSAMQAYQAQRLDELWVAFMDARLRIANLERIIAEWSAEKQVDSSS